MCCLSEACTSTGKVKAESREGGGDRPGVDKVFDSLSSFYKELLVKKVENNKDGFADRRGVCSGMRVSVLSEHNISILVISTITPTC
jgi:hypothetical protein